MCALGLSIGVHFLLKNYTGQETISWLCVAAAAPVAVLDFFQYNGMTFEKFLWALIKSKVLCAGKRTFKAENYYHIATRKKGGMDID